MDTDPKSLSHTNSQYTNDTIIPISKNFLKKTLIKNEAEKKAYKELLDLYKVALEKKPPVEVIEKVIEKVQYVKVNPTKAEKYNIYENIKQKNEMKKIEMEKNKKKREELLNINYARELEKEENYQNIVKEHDLLKKIYFDPINKKKKILEKYKGFLENEQNDSFNNEIKINAYDLIFGKK
jgi:hypothetical protein